MVEILDCTFRDGGYYTNWDFDPELVESYMDVMEAAPIDWVEIGYRSRLAHEYRGEFFYLAESTIARVADRIFPNRLCVMIDAKDWCEDLGGLKKNLSSLANIIGMVRIAVNPDKLDDGKRVAETAKEIGFLVAANLMYGHRFLEHEDELVETRNALSFSDYLYLVDSYGNLRPNQVAKLVSLLSSNSPNQKIGFHAHNNLELAFANSLAAIDAGVDVVDCTITGIGRGAGNLKTELLLTHLSQENALEANLEKVARAVEKFGEIQSVHEWGTSMPYMFSGAHALPQKQVMELVQSKRHSLEGILSRMTNRAPERERNLPKLSSPEAEAQFLVLGGGPSVLKHHSVILEWLRVNEHFTILHSSSRSVPQFSSITNRQLVFLSGEESQVFCEMVTSGVEIPAELTSVLDTTTPASDTLLAHLPNLRTFGSSSDISEKSGFAMAIDFLKNSACKEAYLLGFDGYEQSSAQEVFLHNETQEIIDFASEDMSLVSLLPSSYSNLAFTSIFGLLV